MNLSAPRTVAASVVEQYRQDVEVARFRLQTVLADSGQSPFAVWLRQAEAAAQSAESQWRRAVAANQRVSGAINDLEVERLRIRAELAQIRVEQGRAVVQKPAEQRLQWELDLLHDEVDRLNEAVLRYPNLQPAVPIWWY